jgi:hypothetical protein
MVWMGKLNSPLVQGPHLGGFLGQHGVGKQVHERGVLPDVAVQVDPFGKQTLK